MSTDVLTLIEPESPDIDDRSIWLVLLSVSALHSTDVDAEKVREHTLDLLRETPELSLGAAETIAKQAANDPLLRWSIVNTVAAIGHEGGVRFLQAIAAADYGELNPESCGEGRDTELLVAIMAAEGLSDMALHSSLAAEALVEVLSRQKEAAIREAAGRGLIDIDADKGWDLSKETLDELKRIRSLRPVVAEDLAIDPAEIDVRQPKPCCARRPNHPNVTSSPAVSPSLGGTHSG